MESGYLELRDYEGNSKEVLSGHDDDLFTIEATESLIPYYTGKYGSTCQNSRKYSSFFRKTKRWY